MDERVVKAILGDATLDSLLQSYFLIIVGLNSGSIGETDFQSARKLFYM